jgi:hypothetical protein
MKSTIWDMTVEVFGSCFLGLLFNPEDGDNKFLRYTSELLTGLHNVSFQKAVLFKASLISAVLDFNSHGHHTYL